MEKWNICTLTENMNGVAVMKNSVVGPQNINNRISLRYSSPISEYRTKELTARLQHAYRYLKQIYIVAKRWKQPKYPPAAEWVNGMWHVFICTMKRYSA